MKSLNDSVTHSPPQTLDQILDQMEEEAKVQILKKLTTLKHCVEFRKKFNLSSPSTLEVNTRKVLWKYGIKDEYLPH